LVKHEQLKMLSWGGSGEDGLKQIDSQHSWVAVCQPEACSGGSSSGEPSRCIAQQADTHHD